MHNQNLLNEYFSKHWHTKTPSFVYSGFAILDKISPNDKVIDIGCGDNLFKDKIKNLIGIDPANDAADVITTIEDFTPQTKFDVALCLGSINFGDEYIIANQIEKINSLLEHKAKVFWRLNPGRHDHPDQMCNEIDFFPWTFEKLEQFAKQYGFKQINCHEDHNESQMRLYAEWVR